MEVNCSNLRAAIDAKMAPLKVAHTRLAHRSQRPNVELTRDPAQYQLVNEVNAIETNIAVSNITSKGDIVKTICISLYDVPNLYLFQALQSQLSASEGSLKGLIRNQIDLKEDIRIKTKSLHIDKDLCQDLRATIDYSHY